MTRLLINGDNLNEMGMLLERSYRFNCIYADCIYESEDFRWLSYCRELLVENGIFFVQTDYHTVAEYKLVLDHLYGEHNFVNWLIYIQEWGGTSKRFFPRKHDDILMYSKSPYYKFYPDRIQIEKKTKGTAFDKKGTGLKTPCDVFYDLGNFSTIAKERVKDSEGRNIQWQKPLKLMERLILPVTDENEWVLDPFMGTGSTGEWCKQNNRNFVGIELNKEIFQVAWERLEGNES